jgi:hypothetical protein
VLFTAARYDWLFTESLGDCDVKGLGEPPDWGMIGWYSGSGGVRNCNF